MYQSATSLEDRIHSRSFTGNLIREMVYHSVGKKQEAQGEGEKNPKIATAESYPRD